MWFFGGFWGVLYTCVSMKASEKLQGRAFCVRRMLKTSSIKRMVNGTSITPTLVGIYAVRIQVYIHWYPPHVLGQYQLTGNYIVINIIVSLISST